MSNILDQIKDIASLPGRVDELQDYVDDQNTKLENNIEKTQSELNEFQSETEGALQDLEEKYDDLDRRVDSLEDEKVDEDRVEELINNKVDNLDLNDYTEFKELKAQVEKQEWVINRLVDLLQAQGLALPENMFKEVG